MGYHIGIDIGSTSTNVVVIDDNNNIIYSSPYDRHSGLIITSLERRVRDVYDRLPSGPTDGNSPLADSLDAALFDSVSFTGNNAKQIAASLDAPFYWDAQAQVNGVTAYEPEARSIISFGGQDAALLLLKNGELTQYLLNSACAAGTGSFIDVQALRMFESQIREEGITAPAAMIERGLELFTEAGATSTDPVTIATRCTVFAKTDIIHWGNAGKPRNDIIAGIVKGLVHTYMTDLVKDTEIPSGRAVIVGGGALNPLLTMFFKEYFPLLTVPPNPFLLQAYGAALLSKERAVTNSISLRDFRNISVHHAIKRTEKLTLDKAFISGAGEIKDGGVSRERRPREAFLGIDIGSTTSKCVLLSAEGPALNEGEAHGSSSISTEIVFKKYIKTEGRPIDAVKKLLKSVYDRYGEEVTIKGATTTGSGRYPVGMFVGADYIINEITAHGLSAVRYAEETDTIFELGGQDSKYIFLKDGSPVDFNMNKICSAGTGSFLEEMAEKLKINIEGEFQERALRAEYPVQLGDRCTVFMESGVSAAQQQGAGADDICAGLALAVARNYINRVVENRPVGDHIMFLGGPSRNKAVVAAFERLTGSAVTVPHHSEVFGALGAALYARDAYCGQLDSLGKAGRSKHRGSRFRGVGIFDEELHYTERVCTAPNCSNQCKLQVYSVSETTGTVRELIFGDRCGRYEPGHPGVTRAPNYFTVRRKLFKETIQEGPQKPLHDAGQTEYEIILPGHLYMHQFGPLFHTLFAELGIRPLWQLETTEEMVRLGTRVTPPHFCFSKIVSTGHLGYALKTMWTEATVADKIADKRREKTYLWSPIMIDMPVGEPEESGMFCPWTQGTYYTLRHPFDLGNDERVLHPIIHLKEPPETVASELLTSLGPAFGLTFRRIKRALEKGFENQRRFEHKLRSVWSEEIAPRLEDDIALVVIGRPYMLHDPELNLHVGREISRLGLTAIPMDFLPTSDIKINKKYPNMYWGEGAEILRAVIYCSGHPKLFPVIISNFGCGPDSFLSKYIEEIMEETIEGESREPYLELELDAHSARAGIVTRLEAFHDVVRSYHRVQTNKDTTVDKDAAVEGIAKIPIVKARK